MALHCACGRNAGCAAWGSHARGSNCSRPQAKRGALTHIPHRHRARVLCGGRRAVNMVARPRACVMRWPRRVSERSVTSCRADKLRRQCRNIISTHKNVVCASALNVCVHVHHEKVVDHNSWARLLPRTCHTQPVLTITADGTQGHA